MTTPTVSAMLPKAYVLQGEHGEYSDHEQWAVRVFARKEQAEAVREQLQELSLLCTAADWWQNDDVSFEESERKKQSYVTKAQELCAKAVPSDCFYYASDMLAGATYSVIEVEYEA